MTHITRAVFLSGHLIGPTWGSGVCTKEVDVCLQRKGAGRQLLKWVEGLVKDGDFQHAKFARGTGLITFSRTKYAGRTLTRRMKSYSLDEFPSLAHLLEKQS